MSVAKIGQTPDTKTAELDDAWLGQNQRMTEHLGTINTTEMGARQYVLGLGRFLEVDPMEGGSANDYEYCGGDPVGCRDLDGKAYCDSRFTRNSTYCVSLYYAMWALRLSDQIYGNGDTAIKNAFRHFIFSTALSYTFGEKTAQVILGWHEFKYDNFFGSKICRKDHHADVINNGYGTTYGRILTKQKGVTLNTIQAEARRRIDRGALDTSGGGC